MLQQFSGRIRADFDSNNGSVLGSLSTSVLSMYCRQYKAITNQILSFSLPHAIVSGASPTSGKKLFYHSTNQ